MPSFARVFISGLAAISIVNTGFSIPANAAALTRASYEDCQAKDEAAFRTALEKVTADALEKGTANLDYRALVADEWRRSGLDLLIDKQIDTAISEVRDETAWSDLLKSLADSAKSQELATTVAERVYRSDALKNAIESLAVSVGREIGTSIEFATKDAAEPTLECLQAFIGLRYGTTIANAVSGDASKHFHADPSAGDAEITAGTVLKQSSGGIAGATILIVRRQLANMAQRIGQRIVGSVLSRLVSVAAGGVGLVLIAKDIWELRNGVLPIISTEMKSKETKDKVQDEIANAMKTQIGEHLKEIAAAASASIVDVWKEFRRAHAIALSIAEKDEAFKRFLDSLRPESLGRLDAVVAIIASKEGEAGILKRLDNGTLNEAVNTLPEGGVTIAQDTQSLDAGLQWYTLAGDKLPAVITFELHKRAAPKDFDRGDLNRLLTMNDRLAIGRLAAVNRQTRDVLFELPNAGLKDLARGLDESQLTTLASYLTGLTPAAREAVLATVATTPSKMIALSSERVRNAVITSKDQKAAVDMMLTENPTFAPQRAFQDAVMAWEGRINPLLLWEKHPLALVAVGLLSVLVLLWIKRLIMPRRARGSTVDPTPSSAA